MTLPLQIGECRGEHEFIVMEELCFDVLLGVDVIHHMRSVLDLSREKLTFRGSPHEVILNIRRRTKPFYVSVVYLVNRVVIPPGQIRMVRGKVCDIFPERATVLIEKPSRASQTGMTANGVAEVEGSFV